MKRLLSLLLALAPVVCFAQGYQPRGGGAVQGVAQQGQNGQPFNPVIAGALQPAINTNFAAVGLDTFGQNNTFIANGFSGTITLTSNMPKPTNPGEWALVAVDGGQDNSMSTIQGPWGCVGISQSGGCGTQTGGLKLLTLANVGVGNSVVATYQGASTAQNRPLIVAYFTTTPTIRQQIPTSGAAISAATTLAGSTLVLALRCGGAFNISPCVSGVTDTQGNKWFQVTFQSGVTTSNPGVSLWISSTPATAAAADTITPSALPGTSIADKFFVELTGLVAATSNQPTASLSSDALGNLIVRQDAYGANLFNCTVTLSALATSTCLTAPANVNGVPVRAYVTDFQFSTTIAGTATTLQLVSGTGANCGTNTAPLSAIFYPNTAIAITSILGVRTPLVAPLTSQICVTQAGTTPGTSVAELRGFLAP